MDEHSIDGSTVLVVDDDTSLRAAVKELLESVGLKVILFGSATEFLLTPSTWCGATPSFATLRRPLALASNPEAEIRTIYGCSSRSMLTERW
jgi:hypothetical protein